MTWQEYNEQVFKLVKFFGGELYQKKNIDDGWPLWKNLDKQVLNSVIEFAIFGNKPIDLKLEGLKHQPKKPTKYINPDELLGERPDSDYLDKLLQENNAVNLWDLVLMYKNSKN